jgi:hypothetical protein
MSYRLIMGAKGPQIIESSPTNEVGQPKQMYVTRERYSSFDQAEAAYLSLRIRMGGKLTQSELYNVSAILEGVAHGNGQ